MPATGSGSGGSGGSGRKAGSRKEGRKKSRLDTSLYVESLR